MCGRDWGCATHEIRQATLDDHLIFDVDLGDRLGCDVFYGYIAERLSVNTALIYYYFDSKTDLFRATIEHAVAPRSCALAADGRASEWTMNSRPNVRMAVLYIDT